MSNHNLLFAKKLLTKPAAFTKVIFTSFVFLLSSNAISRTVCELPWNWKLQECKAWGDQVKKNITPKPTTRATVGPYIINEEEKNGSRASGSLQAQQAAEQVRIQQEQQQAAALQAQQIEQQRQALVAQQQDLAAQQQALQNQQVTGPQSRQEAALQVVGSILSVIQDQQQQNALEAQQRAMEEQQQQLAYQAQQLEQQRQELARQQQLPQSQVQRLPEKPIAIYRGITYKSVMAIRNISENHFDADNNGESPRFLHATSANLISQNGSESIWDASTENTDLTTGCTVTFYEKITFFGNNKAIAEGKGTDGRCNVSSEATHRIEYELSER